MLHLYWKFSRSLLPSEKFKVHWIFIKPDLILWEAILVVLWQPALMKRNAKTFHSHCLTPCSPGMLLESFVWQESKMDTSLEAPYYGNIISFTNIICESQKSLHLFKRPSIGIWCANKNQAVKGWGHLNECISCHSPVKESHLVERSVLVGEYFVLRLPLFSNLRYQGGGRGLHPKEHLFIWTGKGGGTQGFSLRLYWHFLSLDIRAYLQHSSK